MHIKILQNVTTIITIFIISLQQPSNVNGHRILGIFTHIGGSHFDTFYPIMNGLADRGHDITVLSYFKSKNHSINYKEIIFDGLPVINSSIPLDEQNPSRSFYEMYNEFFQLYELGDMTCRDTLNSKGIDLILDQHKIKPFDLVITELFDSDCMLGVIHLMNIPYIGLSSCALMPWLYDRISLPDIPSYIPTEFLGFSDKMNFYERFTSFVITKSVKLLYRLTERNDNWLLKERFGDGIPDVADLAKNVSLILINQHYSSATSRPLTPQIIEIGGIHITNTVKPIPEKLKNLLDKSINGVILISWGSNIKASTLSEEKVNNILLALKRFPTYTIIWKWENDTMTNKPNNVHIHPWLPQKEILCHPNVRLFWSHGGNLGTSESVHCGVPMVITPIYGDQFLNAAALENRGMAVSLPYKEISNDKVFEIIQKGLDPVYGQMAKTISYSYRNRIKSPLDTAIWWIEHVIETNGLSLAKSYATQMSWFTYHSVDVLLTIFLVLLVICWVFYKLVFQIICRRMIWTIKSSPKIQELTTKSKKNK